MQPQIRILIASDHAGVLLKSEIQNLLRTTLSHVQWTDLGPSDKTSVDYPDYAETLSRKLIAGEGDLGILICGTGIGMSIAANKIDGIRAACVENPVSARLSKEHNNANVLCFGARFLAPEYAAEIVETWIKTPFSNGPRHANRVEKIRLLEKA